MILAWGVTQVLNLWRQKHFRLDKRDNDGIEQGGVQDLWGNQGAQEKKLMIELGEYTFFWDSGI